LVNILQFMDILYLPISGHVICFTTLTFFTAVLFMPA